jgi:hypothetical protein
MSYESDLAFLAHTLADDATTSPGFSAHDAGRESRLIPPAQRRAPAANRSTFRRTVGFRIGDAIGLET